MGLGVNEMTDIPLERQTMGRKQIKSFASGIAHMFASSAQHYGWLAYRHRLPVVTIDLLAICIRPAEFDIERNRNLAVMCRKTLLKNVQRLAPPGTVVAAILHVNFGIDDYVLDGLSATIGRSVVTVTLTDERGREWQAEHVQERTLVQY